MTMFLPKRIFYKILHIFYIAQLKSTKDENRGRCIISQIEKSDKEVKEQHDVIYKKPQDNSKVLTYVFQAGRRRKTHHSLLEVCGVILIRLKKKKECSLQLKGKNKHD